ncbi:hypothetical protein [Nitrosopumilus sp.]|uniref:hypothetical protein n=1 Tax=Nitrosopumilus sp. TaxID=2024843 RepID=UPI0026269493|nr:hypothetical protein [Nitrosopumilus sp.]
MESFQLTKNWLMNSGIFISEPSDSDFGAVHSFYDEKNEKFAFLYPEITGYYSSAMRFLYEHEQNQQFLKNSKASCDWLIKIFKEYDGIIQGISPDGIPNKFVYSFDTGICAKGMFDCFSITKDQKYLDFGIKLNQWIIDEALEPNGKIKSVKNLSTQKFEDDESVWYKRSGCLHIKLIIPLLQQFQLTGDSSLLNHVTNIGETLSEYQNSDGSILLHSDSNVINLHTMSYALEGLIWLYMETKDQKYLDSFKKALLWCDTQIQNDGSIDLWHNSKYHSKSSYPISQIVRLKLLLAKIENQQLDEIIQKLKSFLLSLQSNSDIQQSNGGFYEEFSKSILGWKKTLKLNSWGTMFSLQALYWIDNFSEINVENEYKFLY